MNVYPGYVLVQQGNNNAGSAGCSSANLWGFNWSDYTAQEQNRILSVLMTEKTAGSIIEVSVDSAQCGPEGLKKFAGHIVLK